MSHSIVGTFPPITVREPNHADVDAGYLVVDEYDGHWALADGTHVYAVIEVGATKVFYMERYVDWWGDGGQEPQDVINWFVARLVNKAFYE